MEEYQESKESIMRRARIQAVRNDLIEALYYTQRALCFPDMHNALAGDSLNRARKSTVMAYDILQKE